MTQLEQLPARIDNLTLQVQQLRTEMRDEFSAVRSEMAEQGTSLRAEIAKQTELLGARIDAQGTYMRVLHEKVLARAPAERAGADVAASPEEVSGVSTVRRSVRLRASAGEPGSLLLLAGERRRMSGGAEPLFEPRWRVDPEESQRLSAFACESVPHTLGHVHHHPGLNA